MAEGRMDLNIGVSNMGRGAQVKRKVTFEQVQAWIEAQGHDEYITKALIKKASSFPDKTYHVFRKNFNVYLAQIQKERKD
jgi:hypothetical protein|tara:strand:- start:266 stop:505 length:240 start_codon:yes stop_codon:yes gene_type:complete